MLRITVELIPHGDEEKKKVISQLNIWNTLDKVDLYDDSYIYGYNGKVDIDNDYEINEEFIHNRNSNVWYLIRNMAINICDLYTKGD